MASEEAEGEMTVVGAASAEGGLVQAGEDRDPEVDAVAKVVSFWVSIVFVRSRLHPTRLSVVLVS